MLHCFIGPLSLLGRVSERLLRDHFHQRDSEEEFWKSLTSDCSILKVVESGYAPPFMAKPPPFYMNNDTTVTDHTDFILSSLVELFLNGFTG